MSVMKILFPERCVCCGRIVENKDVICPDCRDKLPAIESKRCKRCGCGEDRCSCTPIVNHYDRVIAPFYYEDAAKSMVSQIKNQHDGISADVAAAFMSEDFERSVGIKFDAVTCVPTDTFKFVRRGYNPAEMLARRLAGNMGLPFKELLKKRNTFYSQKTGSRIERLQNICGAYKIKCEVKGQNIILVDDVKTTGATLNECSRVLKESGAARVYAAVLCIAAKK